MVSAPKTLKKNAENKKIAVSFFTVFSNFIFP